MALEAILAVEQAEQDAARKKAEAAQKAKEIAAKADREGAAAVKEAAERAAAELWTLAKSAEEKEIKVIIAGAGKAAHLPGMCAALFPMPVVGIPMKTSDLGGVDSLYSIVQMPSGIPVATVAINGGANAGILAAKILATSDAKLLAKLKSYSEEMKNDVVKKADKLESIGYKEYLSQMK